MNKIGNYIHGNHVEHQSSDELPIYEPGLSDVVREARGRNLFFSTDINSAIINSEMIFISVNTPTKTSGEGKGFAADLKYVLQAAKSIGETMQHHLVVVDKSTVPVGTAENVRSIISKELDKRGIDVPFHVVFYNFNYYF